MGEQPIYTTKAHVFQIDPNTKKNWVPASGSAVNVSYYFDSSRNAYRIISVEGSKAVINSTITPNMTFTKTSQKFGQWSDPRANTVYGLGFGAEVDLNKFVEKFQEVKELTRQAVQQATPQSNGVDSSGSSSPVTSRDGTPVKSLDQSSQNLPASQDASAQLKYENDRLKIALAQSSSNAKKWEVELQTLKNNNARLTTALQESTTNVEEWKKQLAAYKEENARLKKRAIELEKGQGSNEQVVALQQQVAELNKTLQQSEIEHSQKRKENDHLQEKVEYLSQVESQNAELGDRIQDLEGENESLQQRIGELEMETSKLKNSHQKEKEDLRKYHQQIANKLSSLYEVHDQMGSALQQGK